MTDRRRVAPGLATEDRDGGVWIMSSAGEKPSAVLIPWDALDEVTLDLMRRLGDRSPPRPHCARCEGPCLREPPHELDDRVRVIRT